MTTINSSNPAPAFGESNTQPRLGFLFNILSNISMGWKMSFMIFVLVLGLAGVVIISLRSLQRLQFHNSNLYEFMLIPIVSLDDAADCLSYNQYQILLIDDETLKSTERVATSETIQTDQQAVKAIFETYSSELKTTIST